MKSKTSFFNQKIFTKNILSGLPIVIFMTCILLLICLSIVKSESTIMAFGDYPRKYIEYSIQQNLLDTTTTAVMKILFVCYSFICGVFVFRSLLSQKQSTTMHALPLTRSCLFVSNVISGLVMLVVPFLLTTVITGAYMLSHGWSIVYLPMWFFVLVGFCLMMVLDVALG